MRTQYLIGSAKYRHYRSFGYPNIWWTSHNLISTISIRNRKWSWVSECCIFYTGTKIGLQFSNNSDCFRWVSSIRIDILSLVAQRFIELSMELNWGAINFNGSYGFSQLSQHLMGKPSGIHIFLFHGCYRSIVVLLCQYNFETVNKSKFFLEKISGMIYCYTRGEKNGCFKNCNYNRR